MRSTGQALSRTYGRLFAEFLNEDSPVRLGVLHQPTCVGLRYARNMIILDAFLGSALCRISAGLLRRISAALGYPSLKRLRRDFPLRYPKTTNVKSNNAPDILHSVPSSKHVPVREY